MRIGILPSAGRATRLNGIPKFLLPVSDDVQCLLDHHVRLMRPFVDQIFIPTRPEWKGLLESFAFGEGVVIQAMETQTMAETLHTTLDSVSFGSCVLGMPDTYFVGGNPYKGLGEVEPADLLLSVVPTRTEQSGRMGSVEVDRTKRVLRHADKDPNRDYGWHWVAMEFSPRVLAQLNPAASTGGYMIDEALKSDNDVRAYHLTEDYFDCGTFAEYLQCLAHLSLSDE